MSLRTKRDRIVLELEELTEERMMREEREVIRECIERLNDLPMFDMSD